MEITAKQQLKFSCRKISQPCQCDGENWERSYSAAIGYQATCAPDHKGCFLYPFHQRDRECVCVAIDILDISFGFGTFENASTFRMKQTTGYTTTGTTMCKPYSVFHRYV